MYWLYVVHILIRALTSKNLGQAPMCLNSMFSTSRRSAERKRREEKGRGWTGEGEIEVEGGLERTTRWDAGARCCRGRAHIGAHPPRPGALLATSGSCRADATRFCRGRAHISGRDRRAGRVERGGERERKEQRERRREKTKEVRERRERGVDRQSRSDSRSVSATPCRAHRLWALKSERASERGFIRKDIP
jgi:hypothetical protein